MENAASAPVRSRPVKGPPIVENEVLGMVIFVVCEIMLFAGFISSYSLVGARAPAGWWPPPGDPALPVTTTGAATLVLLASGAAVFYGGRVAASQPGAAARSLWTAVALASVFVGYQAYEFVQLLRVGFTLQSSAHGGFFYTMIGAHALHALVAVAVLAWAARRHTRGALTPAVFAAVRMYWYFVVLLWPALYAVVYL